MIRARRLIALILLIGFCVVPRFVDLPQPEWVYEPAAVAVEPQKAEFFTLLIMFAITLVLSELLKPKPKIEHAKPAGLGDFDFPTAMEGRVVPLLWGTAKVSGPNVVWYGDLRQEAITEKIKTGIFSSKKIVRGYKYYLGVQMALCRGGTVPVGSMLRIWVGDKVLWTGTANTDDHLVSIDEPEFLGGNDLGAGGIVGSLRFYRGSMTQTANAYLANGRQVVGGDTPKYTGTCYLVLEQMYLGNSTSLKPWAFELRRIPNGLALASGGSVNSGNDANPMNVIYEILTNTEWGLSLPAGDIDVANFQAAAATLVTEGNGISLLIDRKIEAQELLRMIEQQIDGVVYLERTTGKWRINLARGGYSVPSLQLLNASNVVEVRTFSRGSWSDTSNNVLVKFNSRTLDYGETYAHAQDMANVRLQSKMVSVEFVHPGVKHPALANSIAWRALRTLARPLARAELLVDRSIYNHNPGQVVRWTDPDLGFTDLPMRITKIDLGLLAEGKIAVTLVEDIFVFDTAAFVAPGATNWTPPPQTVVAIPTADSLVFESPRKFVTLDPELPGTLDRIWVGARFQNDAAVDMNIATRPNSGAYTDAGDVSGFLVAGEVPSGGIDASGSQGAYTLLVDADLDSLALLQNAMEEAVTQEDCGTRLANIVVIGNEFLCFKSVGTSGGQLQLTGGFRGFLDSAPAAHAANDRVWILLGNLTSRAFAPGATINVKLLPRSPTQVLPEPSATAINVVMDNRGRRPYPPVAPRFNTVLYPTGNVDLDSSGSGGPGSGLDDRGIAVNYVRRDHRNVDEAAAVVSEATLPADFPTAFSVEYAVEVRNDPNGANTLLFTTPWATGSGNGTIEISRTRILRFTAGVVPSRLRMKVKSRHTYDTIVYEATQTTDWDFNTVSALLSGDFNWAVLAFNVASANYTTPSTGTHTLNIGTAFGSGNVEVSLNGGVFAPVILAGNTTGTFAAVSGDNIRVRHTENSTTDSQTFCELTFGGTSVAYAIFTF